MTGAGMVFFAYIGFDAVSTAAQEAKNPQRDMPIGIIGSLLICTVLYILVSGIATGVVPYTELNVPDPIAVVADRRRAGLDLARFIKLGAIAGLSLGDPGDAAGPVAGVLQHVARRPARRRGSTRCTPGSGRRTSRRSSPASSSPFVAGWFTGREAGQPGLDRHAARVRDRLASACWCCGSASPTCRGPSRPRRSGSSRPAGALSALYLMASLPWRTWERLIIWLVIGLVLLRYVRLPAFAAHRPSAQA